MSILSQLGYPKLQFKDPERFTTVEASLNRVRSELERLKVERVRLSPDTTSHLERLKNFEAKFSSELEARARDIKKLNPNTRAHKIAMLRFFQLQQRRSALLQRAASEKRRNLRSQAIAANRNFYSPYLLNPRSVSGTEAKTYVSATARRIFRNPLTAFPCIQRAVRREVMFAKKHAGIGHKVKRRFNPLSHIGC